jgi:YVTN family beta-propeller protein
MRLKQNEPVKKVHAGELKMKMKTISFISIGLTLFAACVAFQANARTSPGVAHASTNAEPVLREIASFDVPGPKGKRFDYLTIDADDNYLLSAHLGAGQLYVIELKTNHVVATVSPVPGVEGVEYVPELKKVYTSDWHENKIGVVDLKTMKVIARLPTEDKPDGSAYAPDFKKLYVSDERGKAEAVVDVIKDQIIKTLHFDSETGMPQYDPTARLLYLNLQDKNVFAIIDPASDEVKSRYSVAPCKGNHGMTLDVKNRRAFLVCEENNLMAVFDLDQHRVITTFPIADGGDVIKFDPGNGLIYVACYSGAISIFKEIDPNHFLKLADFPTEKRVHSLAVDLKTHRVYAPQEQAGGQPVARFVVYEPASDR